MQVFLPPRELTTLAFLADILEKKRKVLQRFEVVPFELPSKYDKYLTIGKLLNLAQKD